MSAGGYDLPHIPSNFPRYEPRRSSGITLASYERPPNTILRRHSPSPGMARRSYDSYMRQRPDSTYRDGMPNVYRPNNYRPEYSEAYYSRSPSPDVYAHQSRMEPDVWDRGSSWRPPPPIEAPNVWSERKIIPASPTTSSRGHGLREGSSRLFEPSDSWKQTHIDRPSRLEHSPPSDQYFDRRGRRSMDVSPDRSMRVERTPVLAPGNDRYRSASSRRESFHSARSEYDSYRPPNDSNWNTTYRREPVSPTSSHQRRDSGSITHVRSSDRYESPYSSRAISRRPSISPRPVISPVPTPSWTVPDSENEPWSYPLEPPARVASRSSIASTQASNRNSPPVPPPPIAVSQRLIVPEELTGPPKPFEPKGVEIPAEETKHAIPSSKQGLSITISSSPAPPISQISEQSGKDAIVSAPTQLNGLPISTAIVTPPSPPPVVIDNPSTKVKDATEIEQPKPSYKAAPVVGHMSSPRDIVIPPSTHSPILATPPPINKQPTQVAIRKSSLPVPDEIPPFSEASSTAEALRIVVMTRLLCDRQSREERVNPVLAANLSISNPPEAHPIATPDTLIEKMFVGAAFKDRLESFVRTRPLLSDYLTQRHRKVEDKVSKLREEYVSLQERWVVHCNALNEQQKTLASEHENQHTGRTTRRSTAITDAVRSDFEMEQIIASLGVDEATDPNHLSMRNLARIPDMVSVTNGQIDYLFDDTSHLVENPGEYYAPHTGIHDWTDKEKQIFLDKFAAYPKQFGVIADHLPNKTAAQCVDYYYLHKKQFIDFRRVVSLFAPNKRRRRGMGKKRGNGLLADIAKHDIEVNRGSAAISASPSVVARAPRGRKTVVAPDVKKAASALRRNAVQFEETPTSTPTPEPEMRPKRRKTAAISTPNPAMASGSATVRSSASTPAPTRVPTPTSAPASKPVSKAPTPVVSGTFVAALKPPTPVVLALPAIQRTPVTVAQQEPSEHESEPRPMVIKRAKRSRKIKSAATVSDDPPSPVPVAESEKELPAVNVVDGGDSSISSARGAGKKDKVVSSATQWSEDDKNLFLSLLAQHGDNFKRIAAAMSNKTTIQVSNFYKANGALLDLEKVAAKAPKRSPTPEPVDTWKELPFPGAGVIMPAPTTKNATASASALAISSSGPAPSYPFTDSFGKPLGRSPQLAASSPSNAPPRPPTSSGNPYPTPLASQPPMRRLSNTEPLRQSSIYSPPAGNTRYPYPHGAEPRVMPVSSKAQDGTTRLPGTSPLPLKRPSYPVTPYPSTSAHASSSSADAYSGYIPPPAVGSNAPSIVHSPTGMSPPKPLPIVQPVMHSAPMQSYPAQQSDPAHPNQHAHRVAYYPLPPLQQLSSSSAVTEGSTNNAAEPRWGTPRYYQPDGSMYTGPSSGLRDSAAVIGAGARHSYPVYVHPPSPAQRPHPSPSPRSGPSRSASSPSTTPGNAARPNNYYPGWTS